MESNEGFFRGSSSFEFFFPKSLMKQMKDNQC